MHCLAGWPDGCPGRRCCVASVSRQHFPPEAFAVLPVPYRIPASLPRLPLVLPAGLLAGLSLAPLSCPPLLWLALVPLWRLAGSPRHGGNGPPHSGPGSVTGAVLPPPRRAPGGGLSPGSLLSAGWGLLAVLCGHRWLLGLHPLDWVGVPAPLSLPLTVVIWLVCGCCGAGAVTLWLWLARRLPGQGLAWALCLSFSWGCGEVLLARGPLFWIGLGSVALPHDRALAGWGSLGGAGLLSALQLLISWGISRLWGAAAQQRRRILALLIPAILTLHLGGWFLLPAPASATLPLGVVQPAIPTRQKFSPEAQLLQQRRLAAAAALVAAQDARWMVAPEGALPLDTQPDPLAITLISGGFRRVDEELRSSLLVFAAGASTPSAWLDKHRLVLLGEWLPWQGWFSQLGLSAVGGVDAGTPSRLLLAASDGSRPALAVAICYEASQGHALAAAVRRGGQLLLTVANLDPYPLGLQAQMLTLGQQRAIETGRWWLGVGNTGPTALVDSRGLVRAALPPLEPGTAVWSAALPSRLTPYDRVGDGGLWLVTGLLWLLLLGRHGWRSAQP